MKSFALSALVWLLVSTTFAQTPSPTAGIIRGVVVDARDSTPLRSVSVRVQGATPTLTGEDGRFELTAVPAGTQELYVSVVDFILVKRTVIVAAGAVVELTIPIAAGTGTYTETLTVRPPVDVTAASPAVREETLASQELQQLRGLITNDPFRAIQMLPGVSSGDDLRSEFTVRGNAIDHMNFTFEGVPAPFLVHTVQGVQDGGSVAMINGDILDDITLSSGSYPQRFGGRTGAELDFRMREGSRDGTRSHLSVSLTDAAVVLEGPVGRRRSGSWLASVRRSYLDQLIRRLDPENDFGFGFTDLQTKIVYDVNTRHQLQAAIAAGRSRLDREPDSLDLDEVKDGRNATTIGVGTWRYLASPRLVVTQKFAGAVNTFRNTTRDAIEIDRGSVSEALYRADWSYAPDARVTFDGGAQLARSTGMRRAQVFGRSGQFEVSENFSESSHSESGYAQGRFAWGRAALTAGGRVDHWARTGDTVASPWVQAIVPVTSAVTLKAGAGIYRQPPTFPQLSGSRGSSALEVERAYQYDASIEGRLNGGVRWQVSGYDREDRDLVNIPNSEYRVSNGTLFVPSPFGRYQNALDGHSRGVELLLQRRSLNGLSGWLAYSLSYTEYHDRVTNETFWGDWDQRHTLNTYGAYRFNDRVSASARFRYGSNFPAVGYWRQSGSQYFLGESRNQLRVAPYSRFDIRGNRTFTWQENRLTLFVEVVNLLNRTNVRLAGAGISARTFEAFGLFDEMFPRYPSVGFLLEF